jgi:two-component system phosphate regulon response regulator PhoB
MAAAKSILVVEDEADLAHLVRYNLEQEGYVCRCAGDGRSALAEVRRWLPDLIVLDRMLPGMSGDDVAVELRRDPRSASIPIIMLTAKAAEADELVGFALGADDYVTKPFSMKKLLARVAAVLRRSEAVQARVTRMEAGPFELDVSRHELLVHGEAVTLTATEFKLLRALMAVNGRVMSRSQLIDAAMGVEVAVTDRTIDVHVTALRKKLANAHPDSEASAWIQTVRGVGYAFRPPAR